MSALEERRSVPWIALGDLVVEGDDEGLSLHDGTERLPLGSPSKPSRRRATLFHFPALTGGAAAVEPVARHPLGGLAQAASLPPSPPPAAAPASTDSPGAGPRTPAAPCPASSPGTGWPARRPGSSRSGPRRDRQFMFESTCTPATCPVADSRRASSAARPRAEGVVNGPEVLVARPGGRPVELEPQDARRRARPLRHRYRLTHGGRR